MAEGLNPTTTRPTISEAAAILSSATGLTEKDSARAIVELISRRWALVPFDCVKEKINDEP